MSINLHYFMSPLGVGGYCRIALNAFINPLVDESCECTSPVSFNSGNILPANTLPSSTPYWSKLKMFQIIPCTKILCSYNAMSSRRVKGVIDFNRKEFVGRLPLKT